MTNPTTLKILCVGNSFSVDTVEYLTRIAHAGGVENITVGNLYIGGCSINRHLENLTNDLNLYEYYLDRGDGNGFVVRYETGIRYAVCSDEWDIIAIQHGTADGSRNTEAASYANLAKLASGIRALANKTAKIAFNMTWIGEPYHSHPEIRFYNGDTQEMYRRLTDVMANTVAPLAEVDIVSPTGTAIQNARSKVPYELTRDGYHLSFGLGRFIAGLTFFKALTGMSVDGLAFRPDSVSAEEAALAVEAANAAVKTPFAVTV